MANKGFTMDDLLSSVDLQAIMPRSTPAPTSEASPGEFASSQQSSTPLADEPGLSEQAAAA